MMHEQGEKIVDEGVEETRETEEEADYVTEPSGFSLKKIFLSIFFILVVGCGVVGGILYVNNIQMSADATTVEDKNPQEQKVKDLQAQVEHWKTKYETMKRKNEALRQRLKPPQKKSSPKKDNPLYKALFETGKK